MDLLSLEFSRKTKLRTHFLYFYWQEMRQQERRLKEFFLTPEGTPSNSTDLISVTDISYPQKYSLEQDTDVPGTFKE
jgi:hypothetical protein